MIPEEIWKDLGRPDDAPTPAPDQPLEQVVVLNLSGDVDIYYEPKKGGPKR